MCLHGIVAWGGGYENAIKPLCKLQERLLKIIFNVKHYEIIVQTTKSRHILNISQQFHFQALVRHYGEMSDRSIANNKRLGMLTVPKFSKQFCQKSCKYVAVKAFNMLPKKLKHLPNKKKNSLLKKSLKNWLVNELL